MAHPLEAVRARVRQIMVGIDHESPPVGSFIEDFPVLPVAEAARLIRSEKPKSGIQLEDWPESAQKEMNEGKIIHPDGRHPEHDNV